jgi:hypothetical protein
VFEDLIMDRGNPYEAAFEAYLQEQGLCYVAVDETRRSILGDTSVKNLDFIVLGPTGTRLLVDVKGRRFPGGTTNKPRYVWESWTTQEDIDGLTHWQTLFGAEYLPLFVFLYQVMPTAELPSDTPDLWRGKESTYLVRAVPLEDYRKNMRVRSPKWATVDLPAEAFRSLARPFRYFSHEWTTSVSEEYDGPDQARHLLEVTRAALQTFAAGSAKAWRQRRRAGSSGGSVAAEPDADGPA